MKLSDIKEYLEYLVDSFASTLNLELTILQAEDGERIASTGSYYSYEVVDSEAVWAISYARKSIETGNPIVVRETGEFLASLPEKVDFKGKEYHSFIIYPINSKKGIRGVITIASFSEEQQKIIFEKEQQLLDYLKSVCSLIASKLECEELLVHTEIANQQMKAVLENMEEGVLLCNYEGEIYQMNELARKWLYLNPVNSEEKEIKERLWERILEEVQTINGENRERTTELHCKIQEKVYSFLLNISYIEQAENSILCMLKPFSQVQDNITQNDRVDGQPGSIVAAAKPMMALLEQARTAAQYDCSVFITGESGTGKEMLARMLHAESPRADRPFVAINCAAIPEPLLESELFGYEEGAFTGAKKGGKIGKFLLANHGTLFLDEIGDMPLYLQAKLLRVLNDKKVDRIGSSHPVDVDIRIIAATNQDMEEIISQKEFREDLYYRLNVISLHIPPLRERKEDILLLVQHFIEKYNTKLNKKVRAASDEVLKLLEDYSWPGNVRQLENCIEYMMVFEEGRILTTRNMPKRLLSERSKDSREILEREEDMEYIRTEMEEVNNGTLKEQLKRKEEEIFEGLKKQYGEHPDKKTVEEICKQLDISRPSYYRKISQKKKRG